MLLSFIAILSFIFGILSFLLAKNGVFRSNKSFFEEKVQKNVLWRSPKRALSAKYFGPGFVSKIKISSIFWKMIYCFYHLLNLGSRIRSAQSLYTGLNFVLAKDLNRYLKGGCCRCKFFYLFRIFGERNFQREEVSAIENFGERNFYTHLEFWRQGHLELFLPFTNFSGSK